MKKVFLIVAALSLALVAQASFGDLLVDRGLPSTNLSTPRIIGNGTLDNPQYPGYWGSTIAIGAYDPKDPVYNDPANLPIIESGDQFTLPAGAANYYVSDIRIWLIDAYSPETYSGQITNDVPAFYNEFNSISLRLGPGLGPVTTLTGIAPTVTQVQYGNGTDQADPNTPYYYPIWQLDYPVDMTLAGGAQYSYSILPDGKAIPDGPGPWGEEYYMPFMSTTEVGYSSGYPNDGSTGWLSQFSVTDGSLVNQWQIAPTWGGVPNGDYNVQVLGTVPEPSGILLCVFAALGLAGYRAGAGARPSENPVRVLRPGRGRNRCVRGWRSRCIREPSLRELAARWFPSGRQAAPHLKGRFEMKRVAVLLSAVLLPMIAGNARAGIEYSWTDLGTLGSAGSVSGMNAAGQVVGYAEGSSGEVAFLYSGGTMTDLGIPSGSLYSYANGINAAGQVVGYGLTAGGGTQAFLYSNGTMSVLGSGMACAINADGQVVGENGTNHAFLDSGGTMRDLGTLSGYSSSEADGIDAAGQVAGYATAGSGGTQAFLYSNGAMTGLGTLPGDSSSQAYGINAGGQVVGYAYPSDGEGGHAFLYSQGTMTDLGTLSGTSTSQALAINDGGKVVGTSAGEAFVYSNGTMVNLNTLLSVKKGSSAPTLQEATAVNGLGQIVADAYYLGNNIAVLLTPLLLPGDANQDGKVNINDLTIVLANFGQTGMTWTQGEFTGDGTVDINDLTIVLANYGRTLAYSAGPVAAAPEPSAILLAAGGLAGLLACVWRRRKQSPLLSH